MILAIHQPQYMPWLGYMHKMASADMFVLLDDVQFKKNEWQHRNRIRNPNSEQWLSVPNTYRFPQLINEVEIRNAENWKVKHLRSIEMNYKKAAYFSDYHEPLQRFFEGEWRNLAELNIDSVNLIAGFLGIKIPVEISSKYEFPGKSTERLVQICRHFNADVYLAGAGGQDYMDLKLFKEAGIDVRFQDFKCPVYPQVWAKKGVGFIAGLSALDLVLNCGPNSLDILMEKNH